MYITNVLFFFFFQAEDGIRDLTVTGVQTCALPIFRLRRRVAPDRVGGNQLGNFGEATRSDKRTHVLGARPRVDGFDRCLNRLLASDHAKCLDETRRIDITLRRKNVVQGSVPDWKRLAKIVESELFDGAELVVSSRIQPVNLSVQRHARDDMIKGARTREDGTQKFSAPRPHERGHRFDTELAKNRGEQQGLVFAIPVAALERVVWMRWLVRTDAQLNAEVPDLLLRQLQRCPHPLAGYGVLTTDF